MKTICVYFKLGFCILFFLETNSYCKANSKSQDTLSLAKKAMFLELNSGQGTVFKTNDFVQNTVRYQSLSLRCAFASNGNSWEDIAYNMPYLGIGFYKPFFTNNPGLGSPFSLYLFRGSTLAQFTENLGWILELNIGLSTNWKTYDPIENPNNIAIGSTSNAHVGLRTYLEYFLFENLDLKLGFELSHFSNGSARMPNKGVNMGGVSLSLAYHLHSPQKGVLLNSPLLKPPVISKRIDHDLQFVFSSRQTKFKNLTPDYVDRSFPVFGLVYSRLFVKGYKYKWGPSIQLIYDESSNAKAWRDSSVVGLQAYTETAKIQDRFSLGIGLRGEIVMPGMSVFATLGYNVYHKHHYDKRLFQTIGIKYYLKDNLFVTFGISANQFSVAQFLHWSVGYTINSQK